MDEFERELKMGFLEEAEQATADVEQCFLALEEDPHDRENLNKIFRLAHNLKGSSKAVGFSEFGDFTHKFETFILRIKNGELQASPRVVNLLLRANDQVVSMIQQLKSDLDARFDHSELIDELENFSDTGEDQVVPTPEPKIEIPDLKPQLEVQNLRTSGVDENLDVPAPQSKAPSSKALAAGPEESLRVALSKVEHLINYVGEMVILQSVMHEQVNRTESTLLKKTVGQLGKVSKEIQDLAMSLRMIPVKPTFQKMTRIVRDTAQQLGKDVGIQLVGEDTELDKTVLEKINDPLVHLIRNSVDHGIEPTQIRQERGKDPKGTVTLSAFHRSGRLVLEVRDDGGGLDAEYLMKKAIQKGILKPGTVLNEKDAMNLIFAPGFSTKDQATDVSGRGVGMDVVRTNIHELGGEVQIDSVKGVGTTFIISLPLTLAIIEAMVISYGDQRFAIPLGHVFETLKPENSMVEYRSGLGDILMLRGENLPLIRLGDFFNIKNQNSNFEMIAMVIKSGKEPFAILVDDILGQSQVVVKQLGPELSSIKGISGSTILGDGRPALILEPQDLVKRKITSSKPISVAGGQAA